MKIQTDDNRVIEVPPVPRMRKGGKGLQAAPSVVKVVQRIILVDWDDVERREAAGETITPQTWKELGTVAKPAKTGGTIFD